MRRGREPCEGTKPPGRGTALWRKTLGPWDRDGPQIPPPSRRQGRSRLDAKPPTVGNRTYGGTGCLWPHNGGIQAEYLRTSSRSALGTSSDWPGAPGAHFCSGWSSHLWPFLRANRGRGGNRWGLTIRRRTTDDPFHRPPLRPSTPACSATQKTPARRGRATTACTICRRWLA